MTQRKLIYRLPMYLVLLVVVIGAWNRAGVSGNEPGSRVTAVPPRRQVGDIDGAVSRELIILKDSGDRAVSREFVVLSETTGAVSREVIVLNRPIEFDNAVSREVVVLNDRAPSARAVSREVSVLIPPPDLVVTQIIAPQEGLTGRDYEVRWTITNAGAKSAEGSWVDRVFLSTDDQVGNDALLGEFTFQGFVAVAESFERIRTFVFPLTSEQFWIIVTTDIPSEVIESDDNVNNIAFAGPIDVQLAPTPDLVVTSVTPPSDGVFSGSTSQVSFVVLNQGTGATDVVAWRDSVFLSVDQKITELLAQERFLRQDISPTSLLPGESYTVTVDVDLTHDVVGPHHIAIYTDSGLRDPTAQWRRDSLFDLRELVETNNIAFSAPFEIDLEPQPDLQVTTIEFPAAVSSGHDFTVSWHDENIGDGPTDNGSWTDEVYLSADQIASIGPNDDFLGSVPRSGAVLGPGELDTNRELTTTLQVDLEGVFYVKVATDTGNVISEIGLEDNNVGVSAQQVAVTLSPPIDLIPFEMVGPATAIPGHEIQVTWSIRNEGADPVVSATWHDGVYLSSDTVFDPSTDTLLQQFGHATSVDDMSNLVIPDYSKTRPVRLPNDTPPGEHHLIVVADVNEAVFEGGAEGNNALASVTPILVESMPTDLVVRVNFDDVMVIPGAAAAGQRIPVSWQISNDGVAVTPVATWKDRVLLSVDESVSPDDSRLVTARRSGELPPGASYVVDTTAAVPFVAPGNYFLLFASDINNNVFEETPGEDNNVVALPFTVTVDGPDLVVTTVNAPDAASSGDTIHLEWNVENVGTLLTAATVWIDSVFLSTDSVFDASDLLLGSRTHVGGLTDGGGYLATADLELPLDLAGLFRVIVVTDEFGSVFETNEDNNAFPKSMVLDVALTPAANLVVTDVAADDDAIAGQPITVMWTVSNTGAGPTDVAAWRDSLFLSRDGFVDRGFDTFLGSYDHTDFLGSDENRQITRAFQVPRGLSGPYFVLVQTDSNERVFEDDIEFDNFGQDPLFTDVTLPPPSDLVVTDVTPPASGVLGEPETISWEVANQGGDTAFGVWDDAVYLSSDQTWDIDDALFGVFEKPLGDVLPAESYAGGGTATIPPVVPGNYFVIVKTDFRGFIPESDESNDGVSVGTFTVTANTIDLGVPLITPLPTGAAKYYALDTPAGQTVRITLDHSSATAWTELFVRFGAPPTPGIFDFAFDLPTMPDQVVTIPTTNAGTFYILAKAVFGTSPARGEAATLLAEALPFGIESVSPTAVGAGDVTLTFKGSGWDFGTTFALRNSITLVEVAPSAVMVKDAIGATSSFELKGVPFGSYDIVVVDGTGTNMEFLADSFSIEPVGDLSLNTQVIFPPGIRKGTSGIGVLTVTNTGNVDIPFAVVKVVASIDSALLVSIPSLTVENIAEEPNGVAALVLSEIRVGTASSFLVEVQVEPDYPGNAFYVEVAGEAMDVKNLIDVVLLPSVETGRTLISENPDILNAITYATPEELAEMHDFVADREAFETNARSSLEDELGASGRAAEFAAGSGESVVCKIACFILKKLVCRFFPNPFAQVICKLVFIPVCRKCPPPARPNLFCEANPNVCKKFCERTDCRDTFTQARAGIKCPCSPGAIDPNEKAGPPGFGPEGFVRADSSFPYRIDFENVEDATAAAILVTVTDQLDSDLDVASFRLGGIHFGETTIDVPDDLCAFETSLDMTSSLGMFVDVKAGIDPATRIASWELRARDPLTGGFPADPFAGFLPPNDETGRGQGWVDYTVQAKNTAPTGTMIRNSATIVFDFNEPIDTNEVFNTLDADAPTSAVDPLPSETVCADIELTWSGSDQPGGSGVGTFTIYVSKDGGTFVPIIQNSPDTFGVYVAEPGFSYSFYSRATDNAGNIEPAPLIPDTAISVGGIGGIATSVPPDGAIDARQPQSIDGLTQFGWDSVDLTFVCSRAANIAAIGPAAFTTSEPGGGDGTAPSITAVTMVDADTVMLTLSERLEPQSWTRITHDETGTSICLGYLPGDTNHDGTSNPALDLSALIDCINHPGTCEEYQANTDRGGKAPGVLDITRLIDLFNGAGTFQSWTGATIGEHCPTAP